MVLSLIIGPKVIRVARRFSLLLTILKPLNGEFRSLDDIIEPLLGLRPFLAYLGVCLFIMSKEDCIQVEGKVMEALPNGMFRVQLENDHIILAHLSGKMRRYYIKIVVGDTVKIEMSPYDLTKGRITYRNK